MILIIAEKPSLARNIGAGIGKMNNRNGYLEGNGYLITWAFGHLFSLADIEYYSPSPDGSNKWTMQNLPCFPKEFVFEIKKDSKKQVEAFRRIKKEAEKVQWADANYDEFVTTMNIIGQALCNILGTISNGTDVYVISELLPLARAYLENERKFPRI